MISDKLAPYLATELGSSVGSCTYRYLPQNTTFAKPCVVVETPMAYEDGSNTTSASKRKVATFAIVIIAKTHHAINPIRDAIMSLLPTIRGVTIGGLFVQCLLIEDIDTEDAVYLSYYSQQRNPSGDEQGYPGFRIIVRGSYNAPY